MGGENPIRVQSMTTTDTMDTKGTVEQSLRLIEVGCELVRITAPSIKEAQNLLEIKQQIRAKGYDTPLVADIHFTPNAAEVAARIVEKVRINPGNFVDKKKFEEIDYTTESYNEELERIRKKFIPLVEICKKNGTAMRIGTNHGSLSDRIMSRYGDTPHGMVESAMEFLRIAQELDYHSIVLSMKASNPQVMVQAYRLLVNTMMKENMQYPLHLGVTEAGDGEDGRIKSAIGIGCLLEDGLGDTIRVSLTEDPEFEIPVAKMLVDRYKDRNNHQTIEPISNETELDFFTYQKRISREIDQVGGSNVPRVVADLSHIEKLTQDHLAAIGYKYLPLLDKYGLSDQAADFIFLGDEMPDFELPGGLTQIMRFDKFEQFKDERNCVPLFTFSEWTTTNRFSDRLNFVLIDAAEISKPNFDFSTINNKPVVIALFTYNTHAMASLRRAFIALKQANCDLPVVVCRNFTSTIEEEFQLYASTDVGTLLLDGFGDGVWLNHHLNTTAESIDFTNRVGFGILQATRTRISKTEYIACPSCGRTLFDLQETTAKIRKVTDHLKGVKIGIMGCIVNGPGEMADADFGYVGSGIDKITLYKGKEVVQRSISADKAVDALVDLIKESGMWVERD